MEAIEITLSNGALQLPVTVPAGRDAGHIRTLRRELEEIGAPSSYTLAVNGVGVEDSHMLAEGEVISFRPQAGTKGTEG